MIFGFSIDDEPWRETAACRTFDPDKMFPNLDRIDEVAEAKKICSGCPIATQRECAAAAIKTGDKWSVSGGMTPKERKQWANAQLH